ncbi:hypothetical protein SUGI_1121510 [Cryptomeria japonica]|nr:hypothetical protein SUGI_1121510 [Cryptomeria japonica]
MHIGTRGWNSMAMRGWNSMAERIDMNWLEVFLLSNPSGNTNNISKPETPIVGGESQSGVFLFHPIVVHKVYVRNFPSSRTPSPSPEQGVLCLLTCRLRIYIRFVTSNVILYSNLNAKLGDFGLPKIVKHYGPSSHTTLPAGNLGYLAPQCVVVGKTSPESDFLALNRFWDLYKQGELLDSAIRRLGRNLNEEEMQRLMVVGLLCCEQEPKARPEMRYVMKIIRFDVELPFVPLSLYDTSKTFSHPLDPVRIGVVSVSTSSNRNTSRSL